MPYPYKHVFVYNESCLYRERQTFHRANDQGLPACGARVDEVSLEGTDNGFSDGRMPCRRCFPPQRKGLGPRVREFLDAKGYENVLSSGGCPVTVALPKGDAGVLVATISNHCDWQWGKDGNVEIFSIIKEVK